MENDEFNKLVHSQRVSLGMYSEMTVVADLYRRGFRVSQTLDNDQSYDMIVDRGGLLDRIQVKTIAQNGYQVPIGHTSYFWNGVDVQSKLHPKYRDGQFDILAAVDRKTGMVYYIPSGDIDYGKANFSLAKRHDKYRDLP